MNNLGAIISAIDKYNRFVEKQVDQARQDPRFRRQIQKRWKQIRASVEIVTTPTGIQLPRLALPKTDEPGEIARYLYGEGLPGEFPFVNAIYPKMYLHDADTKSPPVEEPTRLFAGLGLAEQ